jgi:hypothetical protein
MAVSVPRSLIICGSGARGYKLTKDERPLRNFVEFLEACGAERVTIELALDWMTLPDTGAPAYLANRLMMVRQFASYPRTIDPATEMPPSRLLRAGKRRATPYVYSDGEIAALIDAAVVLRHPLLVATYRMPSAAVRASFSLGASERDRSDCVRHLGKTPPFRGPHGDVVPGSAPRSHIAAWPARSMGDDS